MLQNILKLEGAEELTRTAQKEIKGSGNDLIACHCPDGSLVVGHADNCQSLIDHFCALES